MKKSRFTNEQIAFALKQAETGTPVEEVCRKIGISQQTFYRWKKKPEGLGVAEDVRRFDQKRQDKKTSNKEWLSATDPSAKINKTHRRYLPAVTTQSKRRSTPLSEHF